MATPKDLRQMEQVVTAAARQMQKTVDVALDQLKKLAKGLDKQLKTLNNHDHIVVSEHKQKINGQSKAQNTVKKGPGSKLKR